MASPIQSSRRASSVPYNWRCL